MKSNGEAKPLEPFSNEKRLVEQARSGDAEAFGKLYDAYVDRVYRIVKGDTDRTTAQRLVKTRHKKLG